MRWLGLLLRGVTGVVIAAVCAVGIAIALGRMGMPMLPSFMIGITASAYICKFVFVRLSKNRPAAPAMRRSSVQQIKKYYPVAILVFVLLTVSAFRNFRDSGEHCTSRFSFKNCAWAMTGTSPEFINRYNREHGVIDARRSPQKQALDDWLKSPPAYPCLDRDGDKPGCLRDWIADNPSPFVIYTPLGDARVMSAAPPAGLDPVVEPAQASNALLLNMLHRTVDSNDNNAALGVIGELRKRQELWYAAQWPVFDLEFPGRLGADIIPGMLRAHQMSGAVNFIWPLFLKGCAYEVAGFGMSPVAIDDLPDVTPDEIYPVCVALSAGPEYTLKK